jgi:hypothetical protein
MNREEFLAQWFLAHESYVLNCSVEDAEDMAHRRCDSRKGLLRIASSAVSTSANE